MDKKEKRQPVELPFSFVTTVDYFLMLRSAMIFLYRSMSMF
jgi:hypothetical protein